MAKREKTTRFSIQGYDLNHYRTTQQYAAMVQALFDRATLAIAKAASRGTIDPDKPFSFDDYPEVKAELQKVTGQLASNLQTTIETGSKKQWLFACQKNDAFLASIMDTSKLSKARLKQLQDRNLDALSAFQTRKVSGMDLSQRVWRYVGQFKDQIECALDVGLGDGRSAQQLARDVKQNLKEPNRLFRRVRDKRGNLVLSKAARAYHPGQGVYRSSVKNAQRLTRSEINMAYRESDFLRWQQLDFVVGFEIHRSNHKPLCKCKMCDKLQGRYPKTFKFKGWHPQCMCYAIPILADEETFDENELGDLKAALRGTEYKHKQSKNLVADVPDGFKEWVAENMEAAKGWSSTPYFIKDNFVDGDLSKGLKIDLPTIEPDTPFVPDFDSVLNMSIPEIVSFLTSNGFKSVDFGNMRINDVRKIAHSFLTIKERFGLDPIAIDPNENSRTTLARGGADAIHFNRRYSTPNAQAKCYEEQVVAYQNKLRDKIAKLDARYSTLVDLEYRYSQSSDYVEQLALKDIRKEMSEIMEESLKLERMLENGDYRYSVFLSPETCLMNTAQHEIAHTIKAQILGGVGIFGNDAPTARKQTTESAALLNELNVLFKTHRGTADEWLSIYGKTDNDEFMAEAFVLYINGKTERMPKDVVAWFEKLEQYANGGKIKVNDVQEQLDALMPLIASARNIADEWGLENRLKGLDAAVAARDIKDINKFINLITTDGTKYAAAMSAWVKEAGQVIQEMKAAGGGSFNTEIAELSQYITNLSGDKTMWVDGASFYESELAKAKEKLRQYQSSPEALLNDSEKRQVAETREIIRQLNEWGLKSNDLQELLDKFLEHPNDDAYWKMWDLSFRAEGRIRNAEQKVDKIISEAVALMKDAKDLGVDDTEVSRHHFALSGRDKAYYWANYKRDINKAINDLQVAVDEAKKKKEAEEAVKPKLDTVIDAVKAKGVAYNEVKAFDKQPTMEEIITRVGGGDNTDGSCASLAYAYAANRGGLDVLDFRDGESRYFFALRSNGNKITDQVGGFRDVYASGMDLMKKTEVGKEYVIRIGCHAAVVRQVSKGKYEYLELQSATSNGWKPLNAKQFAWRFSARGRCGGSIVEISKLYSDPSFKKLMGYINTDSDKQKKSETGTIK